MRDSNYRLTSNNRAAVTITTSLYDRRALDVTADKPLINSLNHLTYLVLLSAKVRETLSNDGGIERLVEVLHECHHVPFSASYSGLEQKLLTAWKWTLAFQCLVLIGTRGTESVRQKVVRAGMLPVIATVLDNYMTLHESNFAPVCPYMMQSDLNLDENLFNLRLPEPPADFSTSLNSDDFESLSVEQLLKLVRCGSGEVRLVVLNDLRRRFLISTVIKKLRVQKETEPVDGADDMDCNLHFLLDLYLQDDRQAHLSNMMHAKLAPRTFTERGVVIPRDDDVVWCLQLLAYISKYPYLKEVLQKTHLVPDMSVRDAGFRVRPLRQTLVPRLRKGRLFNLGNCIDFHTLPSNSPPMQSELMSDVSEKLDMYLKGIEDAEAGDFDDDLDDFDEDQKDDDVDDYLSNFEDSVTVTPTSLLDRVHDQIVQAEAVEDDIDREIALCRISEQVNRVVESECKALCGAIVEKRACQKLHLAAKWNYLLYDNFSIDEPDPDLDPLLAECERVDLFPMVEKFTFLSGTDMYYWLGVIMRNSCRRNDCKGGVRQCGNLECGRWELYPREFSKCKRCKRTKYCSRECQKRAWNHHKNWCVPSSLLSAATSAITSFDGSLPNATVAPLDSEPTLNNE